MLILYEGTPGSGKSYHATLLVHRATKRRTNVIANFVIKLPEAQSRRFYYRPTAGMTVKYLRDFATQHHADPDGKIRKESQTILMIDEAAILFNCREFNRKDRSDWLVFFSQHRKLGFDIILITQMDRSLDRQVRGNIELRYIHRKLTNFGLKGWFLRIITMKSFICIHEWYTVKEKINHEYFGIKRKIAESYDTFSMFDEEADEENVRLPIEEEKKITLPEERSEQNAINNTPNT